MTARAVGSYSYVWAAQGCVCPPYLARSGKQSSRWEDRGAQIWDGALPLQLLIAMIKEPSLGVAAVFKSSQRTIPRWALGQRRL